MKSLVYTISILLTAIFLNSCCSNQVRGNGNIVSQEISISDYKTLELSGGIVLVYEQNAEAKPYLRIEIDENLYPLLDINSSEGHLKIGARDVNPTKFNVYTNSAELARLKAAGSVDAHLKGMMKTTNFALETAGSSKIKVDNIVCSLVSIDTAGSSNITITGETEQVQCSTAGSSDINILDLKAQSVKCNTAGSSYIQTYAEKTLNVDVAGSGKIRYKGQPSITQSISGSGSVESI